jgi:pimeloyl-ACP methyl ester carboxylesterase
MMRASNPKRALHLAFLAVVAALGLLVVVGCASATPTPTPAPTPTPTPSPTPPAMDVRAIEFTTSDGVTLGGRLFGAGDKWVLLAHMAPADQSSWEPFARELASRGYRALTFNFRGYQPSGGSRDIPRMNLDAQAALKYARDSGAARVYLIGASMGGTAMLSAAATEELPAVVALSAPQRFQGLEVSLAQIIGFKTPVLFLASQDDKSAADDARNMYDSIKVEKEIAVLRGGAHGTNLLIGLYGQDAKDRILSFLERHQ